MCRWVSQILGRDRWKSRDKMEKNCNFSRGIRRERDRALFSRFYLSEVIVRPFERWQSLKFITFLASKLEYFENNVVTFLSRHLVYHYHKGYRGRVEPYISEFCQMCIAFVTFSLLPCFLTSMSGIDETCWEW